jgi:hypothetical protein
MYLVFLSIHNIFRWLVVAAALFALFQAYSGWLRKRAWQNLDRTAGIIYTSALDIQMLLGVVLMFLIGLPNLGRFLMEHIIPMALALVFAHVGSSSAKKADVDADKHRKAALWFSAATLVMLLAVPWARPLFRFF